MSAKTMFGAQPRKVQPGGFTSTRRSSRKGRVSEVRESARAWLFRRGIEQIPFQNHDFMFGKRG